MIAGAKEASKAEQESLEGGGPVVTEADIANIVAQVGARGGAAAGSHGTGAWALTQHRRLLQAEAQCDAPECCSPHTCLGAFSPQPAPPFPSCVQWTGIPIEKVSSDETERLIKMEEVLHGRWEP